MSWFEYERKVEKLSPERKRELLADGVCSLEEAKAFTGLKRTKLYDLMAVGELPYVKIGGARRIPRRALVELLERNLVVNK